VAVYDETLLNCQEGTLPIAHVHCLRLWQSLGQGHGQCLVQQCCFSAVGGRGGTESNTSDV